MANLMVVTEAVRVVSLIKRAEKSGYNGLVLSDYKMNVHDQVQPIISSTVGSKARRRGSILR